MTGMVVMSLARGSIVYEDVPNCHRVCCIQLYGRPLDVPAIVHMEVKGIQQTELMSDITSHLARILK
jgi:hypothetical protein